MDPAVSKSAPEHDSSALGSESCFAYCEKCRCDVYTQLQHETGRRTILSCVLIAMFGGCLFCFLIPWCVDSCLDVNHICPTCGNSLGVYRRL
ncbi:hypothetical protein AAHC03_013670 [Spirometra sp. Aus1]|nr:unnamed protein product [Spirometra erinaceieuropaei]